MGTDIHGRIQRRYNPEARYDDVGEIEDDRNYAVFAMLAGVRNGYGFAGVRTHEPIQPISEPRGLPADLGFKERDYSEFDDSSIAEPKSREVPYDDFEFGDHSQSWLTLREVLDWPHWDAPLRRCGYLERAEYERMVREGGLPREWCGDVDGLAVVKTTYAELLAGTAPEGWTNVLYEWGQPFRESVRTFRCWIDYLAAKHDWLIERDPAAVRLVFGFDS